MENTVRTMNNAVKWKMDIFKTVKKLVQSCKVIKLSPIAPLMNE